MTKSFVRTRSPRLRIARLFRSPIALTIVLLASGCRSSTESPVSTDLERKGREIFRYDTFGDERFWTDTAKLHTALETVRPLEALGLGVKVDLDHLNLWKFLIHNPFGTSGTRELLRQNAVVGVQAKFDGSGHIASAGITCAFCHSTVDNALLPGIGYRLDGWPNRDLKVGKILAMLPVFTTQQKTVLRSWPKGSYDPRFNFDGKSTPLVLPPAYGLALVKNETYTAEGPISYWNAYVAVTQMHGHGNFADPRLGVNIVQEPDMVTSKLAPLRAYQHSIPAPAAPASNYDATAAASGRAHLRGQLCYVSRQRERDRQQPGRAPRSERDRNECGVCGPDEREEVPHHAVARPVATPSILPRWERKDTGRCRESLCASEKPSTERRSEETARRIPEIAVAVILRRRSFSGRCCAGRAP